MAKASVDAARDAAVRNPAPMDSTTHNLVQCIRTLAEQYDLPAAHTAAVAVSSPPASDLADAAAPPAASVGTEGSNVASVSTDTAAPPERQARAETMISEMFGWMTSLQADDLTKVHLNVKDYIRRPECPVHHWDVRSAAQLFAQLNLPRTAPLVELVGTMLDLHPGIGDMKLGTIAAPDDDPTHVAMTQAMRESLMAGGPSATLELAQALKRAQEKLEEAAASAASVGDDETKADEHVDVDVDIGVGVGGVAASVPVGSDDAAQTKQ